MGNSILPEIVCFFDGAFEETMGIGCLIYQDGIELESHSEFFEQSIKNSNNVAEYLALKWVLSRLIELEFTDKECLIMGDSQMAIFQMIGRYAIKKGRYTSVAIECKELVKKLPNIFFKWIPREDNTEADALSKAALKSARDKGVIKSYDEKAGSEVTYAEFKTALNKLRRK